MLPSNKQFARIPIMDREALVELLTQEEMAQLTGNNPLVMVLGSIDKLAGVAPWIDELDKDSFQETDESRCDCHWIIPTRVLIDSKFLDEDGEPTEKAVQWARESAEILLDIHLLAVEQGGQNIGFN